MIIALCGYMGAGKTTLGKMLAEKLNYSFLDTDEYIESKEKRQISEIFEKYGESYFRELEYKAVSEISLMDKIILSLGGGLPINDKNKQVLKKMFVVYIDSSFEDCYNRIASTDRPIVRAKSKEQLKEHYNSRIPHYMAVANIVCEGNDLEKMAEQIAKSVKEKI